MANPFQIKTAAAPLIALLLTAGCGKVPPPLHQAIMDQDEKLVEELLESGDDPMEIWRYTQPGHSGATFRLTPLSMAVTRPNQRIIRLLASHGAGLYETNQHDMTVFEWAIRFDHFENVRLLWELSDQETYRQHGANALRLAFIGGHTEMFEYLLEEVATPESIGGLFEQFAEFGAAGGNGGLKRIDELLALGLEPTTGALVKAVGKRNLGIMQQLLDAGVSIEGPADEYSPLHQALPGWDTDVVRWLLEGGADPNALDPYGRPPAMTVVRVRRPRQQAPVAEMREDFQRRIVERLELLVRYGADLNLRAADGRRLVEFLDEEHDPDAEYSRAQLKAFLSRTAGSAQSP